MTLRYTNNSPDTLRFVWFQVEQNAFKNNSLNSFVFPPESRFGARNFEGGDVIDRFNQVTASGQDRVEDARRRHGDEGRSRRAARARADRDVRRRVALQHSGARRRSHGPRRRAVRARAVVSARLRLRRPPRLEHRAVSRPGRVLSRVRRLQPLGDRAGRLHRRRDGRAAEPDRGADADADLATGAGGEVRRRRSTSSPKQS